MSQTVSRAIEILNYVAEAPKSLTEVASHVDTHKSTASRLLAVLEREGMVRRTPDGRHALGFELLGLAERALSQIDLRTVAHQHVVDLSRKVGQTVHLAQLIGDEVIYVDKVDGPGPVALASRIGLPAEYHTAGVAKAILAHLERAPKRRILSQIAFHRYTDNTITSPAAFQRELTLVQQRGWAVDDGEKEDYIRCIACPIYNAQGKVTISLSITALQVSTPVTQLVRMINDVQATAQAISREIGGMPPVIETGEPT